jgi:hypothetical protein
LISPTGNVIGVFEALDKRDISNGATHAQRFTKKDEGILKMAGETANYIMN